MAYATVSDVQARMTRTMSTAEQTMCGTYLDDVAVLIDSYNVNASANAKLIVSCRVVIRALGDGSDLGVPMGASQGSMSALGYSQSWTIGTGGSVGELYLSKTEKKLLGCGEQIGSYSPTEELVPPVPNPEAFA
jgi:hypothetical protein